MIDNTMRSIRQAYFAIKNERRRECKHSSKSLYKAGRSARKAHSINGAFGTEEDNKLYNKMVDGTKGTYRSEH